MFTIIGGDGKEYGPVGVSQIRSWLVAGRASLATKARAVGSDEWRTLGEFADFNDSLGGPPPLATVKTEPPAIPADAPFVIDPSNLASRGLRTSAALINAFFYFICTIPGSLIMSRKLLEQNPELAKGGFPRLDQLDLTPLIEGVVWVWVGLLSAMFLQSLLLAMRGQNLGKLMFGLRVVRVADGEPADFVHGVLLRFLVPVAIVLLLNATTMVLGFVFLAVDYSFMFREDQRCLHDLMAGTKVVKAS